ncbi:MAG TPA: hypothetical protein VGL14_10680 [Methylomirabilota bacterium]
MRLVVKKLDVVNLDQLQSLVVEHIDGIETDLTVLDSRLLLGHATVDIVAVDSQGALVLVTAGFTADEEMLMKAVEAYSWCLEYPEAIRRLYPSVDISAARPPRLMFVVERMPDAFHRKIKQLGFCEVDCVEFRHLDVSGTQAAYFDTIARLRRGASAEFQPAPIARRVSEPSRREAGERSLEHRDKVVPLVSAPNSARATSVRLQKMLNTNGHANGGAPVIDIASRTAAPRIETPAATVQPVTPRAEVVRIDKTPRVEKPSRRVEAPVPVIELPREEVVTPAAEPVLEIAEVEIAEAVAAPRMENPAAKVQAPVVAAPIGRVSLREAIPVPAPVAIAAPAPEQTEPRVSFAEIAKELLGTPAANGGTAGDTITRATLEEIAAAAADSLTETNGTVAAKAPVAPKPVFTAPKSITPAPKSITPAPQPIAPALKPFAPAPKPFAPAPKPIAPAPQPIAPAPKPIAPGLKPIAPAPNPAAPAPKLGVPAPKPAAAAAVPAAKPAAAAATDAKPGAADTAAQNMPQEFEGLKFPNDGVLTRQWMEFLNQMASGK